MVEKIFEELGFLTEQTCKSLQKVMDGKSFYGLQVKYSNCHSNCTLIVRSDNEEATPDDIGTMFLHIALGELGSLALKKFILETYITKHLEKDQRIVFFMEGHQYTAWFKDAKIVSVLLGLRKGQTADDGYEFVFIDRDKFQRYADYLGEQGWELEVIDITDFGR